tara:strand:+ start:186 stop:1052 length:867 start_codon:yes stop_codon:yes gene_type:complete
MNKFLNMTLNRSSRLLSDSKDKILIAAKKRAKEEVNNYIPNPSNLESQLKSLQTNKDIQGGLLRAEIVYNKTISIIDKAIIKLEITKLELVGIKGKLDRVIYTLNIFDDFIVIIKPILNTLRGILPAIDGSLAASTSLAANGLIINKLGEKKKDLKDALKSAQGSITSFPTSLSYFDTEINKIMKPLNQGISGLEQQIQKLKEIKAQIVAIYTQFILSLDIVELTNENNDSDIIGGGNLEDYINNEDNLSNIISNLNNRIGGGNMDSPDPSDDTAVIPPSPFIFKRFN